MKIINDSGQTVLELSDKVVAILINLKTSVKGSDDALEFMLRSLVGWLASCAENIFGDKTITELELSDELFFSLTRFTALGAEVYRITSTLFDEGGDDDESEDNDNSVDSN